jgi:Tfp pilus assembly protein PilO
MNLVLQQSLAFARRFPLLVSGLVCVVLFGLVNYFLWQQQVAATRQHDDFRRTGEAMLLSLTDQSRISAELAAVQDALKVIDQNLVVEADLANNNGYFYEIEDRSHVRLTQLNQLSAQPGTDDNAYKAVPFSLRVTGTYPQIVRFIRELETGPRLLRIKNYNFGRGDEKSNALALSLTLEMLGSP